MITLDDRDFEDDADWSPLPDIVAKINAAHDTQGGDVELTDFLTPEEVQVLDAATVEERARCGIDVCVCGAWPGSEHVRGCAHERCPICGNSVTNCDCGRERRDKLPRIPWTAEDPDQ